MYSIRPTARIGKAQGWRESCITSGAYSKSVIFTRNITIRNLLALPVCGKLKAENKHTRGVYAGNIKTKGLRVR